MIKLIFVVVMESHRHINNSQHHKDKRLQGNNNDVEQRPTQLQHARAQAEQQAGAEHNGDQNKDHLTGVEIAKQPQTQRYGFCYQSDNFQNKVKGNNQRGKQRSHAFKAGLKGIKGQLFDKAEYAFFPDADKNNQQKHGQAHSQGHIGVSGGHNLEIEIRIASHQSGEMRNPVHWHQVHQIHQKHPDKDGQRQGSHKAAFIMKAVFYCFIDKLNNDLNEIEQGTGNTGVSFFCAPAKQQNKDKTEADGPGHRVNMDGIKTHG